MSSFDSKFLRVVNCSDCEKIVLKLTEGSLVSRGLSLRCSECETRLQQRRLWNEAVETKFKETFYPTDKSSHNGLLC